MDSIIALLGDIFNRYLSILAQYQWLADLAGMGVLFFGIVQILCAVGLFCVFGRLNTKRWPAAVPLSGIYWLGELVQRRVAAIFIVFSKLLFLISCMEYVMVFFREDDAEGTALIQFVKVEWVVISLCLFVAALALLIRFVAGLFLYGHLCGKYEVSKWWLVPFSLIPYVTMIIWSMNPKVRNRL